MNKLLKNKLDFCHILKARAIVAYALLSVFPHCSGITKAQLIRALAGSMLILIPNRLVRLSQRMTNLKECSRQVYKRLKITYCVLYADFFREYKKHRKTLLADYAYVEIDAPSLGSYFPRIIGVAWLCEKLNLNIKFTFPDTYIAGNINFFENSILAYSNECQNEKFMQLEKPLVGLRYYKFGRLPRLWEAFAKARISSEYGYNVLTQLSIKEDLRLQAEQWWHANAKQQKYIGVHYRLSDVLIEKRVVKIEDYIEYLKKVLDSSYGIFACSDNIEFIKVIHHEFPGRVISRDITRSDSFRSLHRHAPYAGDQQKRDAIIDVLTLAKTEMIYTIGSFFIDIVRFFNPSIKIFSTDERSARFSKSITNYPPSPQVELMREYRRQSAWKKAILGKEEVPPHIEIRHKERTIL